MPTVVELSDPYANFLLTPGAPEAGGVCSVCLTLIEGDYPRCYPCQHHARGADGFGHDVLLVFALSTRARSAG